MAAQPQQQQQPPANPPPANPQPANPQPGNPQPANPQPANPQPANPQPANPQPANPQQGGGNGASRSGAPASTPAASGNSTAPAPSGSSSGSVPPSGSASSSGSAPSSSSTLSIPQSAPAGSLTITQPPQTATSYFKIAQNNIMTIGWNFTDVIAMPTSLTVQAVCDNGNTYPVGPSDGIIPGTATSLTWDLWSYQQAHPNTPLAQQTYTLYIWDDRGPGARMQPGFLSENNQMKFALYSPAPYTPLASWTCNGCNTSGTWATYIVHPAFVSLVATIVVVFLSGYSVLRHAAH